MIARQSQVHRAATRPMLLRDRDPHAISAMAEEDKKASKRRREKERRQEFTEAYEQLSTLILEVDPCSDPHEASELSEGKTRIELIHRSISLIRRLHDENTRLRSRIRASSSNNALDDDVEVMLIVPTLTPVADDAVMSHIQPTLHRRSSTPRPFPPAPPQMPPQPYYEGASPAMYDRLSNTSTTLAAAGSVGYNAPPHHSLLYRDQQQQQHPSRYLRVPPPPPPMMHRRSEFYPPPEYATAPGGVATPASPRFTAAPSPHSQSSPRSSYEATGTSSVPSSPSSPQQQHQHHGSPRFGHPRDTTGV